MIIMIIVIITILSRHHNQHLVIGPRPPQEKVKVLNGLNMSKCQIWTVHYFCYQSLFEGHQASEKSSPLRSS